MNKVIIILCGLLVFLTACSAPSSEVPPAVEAPPASVEIDAEDAPSLIYDVLVDAEDISVQVKKTVWQKDKSFSTQSLYHGNPLTDYAVQYLEAYGQALLEASRRHPQNIWAIEGFELLSEPQLVQVGSADNEPFVFSNSVSYTVKPLHYEDTYWWAGSTMAGEDGWLEVGGYLMLSIDEAGLMSFLAMDSAFPAPSDGYIPVGLIHESQEVYSQFELDTSYLLAENGERLEYQGYEYTASRFTTRAELKDYLRQYFSEEITESLLNRYIITEAEGRLYVIDSARGGDIRYQGERWLLEEDGPSKKVYHAEEDFLFPEEPEENMITNKFEYMLELGETGWVFTRFEFYL